MKRILRAPAAAALTAILYSSFASAQLSTSTITGSVVDPQGLGMAAAKVVATNEATSVSHESVTTSAGDYSVSGLPPGTYTITISQTGFRTFTSLHNVLNVGAPIVVNATLAVGATQEIVTVEGQAAKGEAAAPKAAQIIAAARARQRKSYLEIVAENLNRTELTRNLEEHHASS